MAGLMVGLTRGIDAKKVLEDACRVGAFVASHNGATPLLPRELMKDSKFLDVNAAGWFFGHRETLKVDCKPSFGRAT